MKKIIKWMLSTYQSCGRCFGTGSIELPNGDTKTCHICEGKGIVK